MPTEILAVLPQLGEIVNKLGVVGVLIVAIVWLLWDRMRLMKQAVRTFAERDMHRLVGERYRAALVAAGVQIPDTVDLVREYEKQAAQP